MPVNDLRPDRRSFLAAALAAAAAAPTVRAETASGKSATIDITPSDLMRVRVEIDVKGNVLVSDNAVSSKETRKKFPVTSKATLDYEERSLRPVDADLATEIVASERFYHTAESQTTLNKTSSEQKLRPATQYAIVRRESLPETIYSPNNYFTHGELSLLKSPVSSVSADRFLPVDDVIEGDRYELDRDALCSVLNLTSVDSGTVESSVVEITDTAIRFKIEGDIEASIDGVETRQRMIGKMTFDRELGTCTWLALAIHETRQIGRSEPGFDITATIRMVRRPMEAPVGLPSNPATIDFDSGIPSDRMYVELQSRELGVGSMMDRRWQMIEDTPAQTVMRMVERDISIAQCNVRPLTQLPEGKKWSIEAFEGEVRRTLGDRLSRLVEGDQRTSAQGLDVLRVVVDGETQGVRIRWIMMHLADQSGRRVQATFTMSGDQIDQFAGSDAQFADSMRFLETADVHDRQPTDEKAVADSGDPESTIAELPTGEEEATSSSDLR